MVNIGEILLNLWSGSGFATFGVGDNWKCALMIIIGCVLLYLGIVKKFEPLLLVGIAFGCILSNLPMGGLYHQELWDAFMDPANPAYHSYGAVLKGGGLLDIFYIGVKTGLYPCIIFMGVGAMTDFGPLLSNPSSLLLGAAAQLGVFVAFFGANVLGFTPAEASSIGIIGGADGPTAIFVTTKLAPHLLGAIAVAAYSYMALIPMIQPPIMKLLTTEEQRKIVMTQTRKVSKAEKIIFPVLVTVFVALLLPDTAALIGCLMLGNLFKETGVTARLSDTVQNALMNIVTI
ncbi:MAG: sodium ion-translocating decarboxylase subunit beta, partial [Clostridia bacterium]|nr:sodium ion-translocating decarboxylase subunit beta [Clostridia bacterium]